MATLAPYVCRRIFERSESSRARLGRKEGRNVPKRSTVRTVVEYTAQLKKGLPIYPHWALPDLALPCSREITQGGIRYRPLVASW